MIMKPIKFAISNHLMYADGYYTEKPTEQQIKEFLKEKGFLTLEIQIIFLSRPNQYYWSCKLKKL